MLVGLLTEYSFFRVIIGINKDDNYNKIAFVVDFADSCISVPSETAAADHCDQPQQSKAAETNCKGKGSTDNK